MADSSLPKDRGPEPSDPEEWKRYVDRAKLRIDQDKEAREQRFSSRNSAALIAGSIATAGVLVTAIGLWVSYEQRERDLRQQNERTRLDLENSVRRDSALAAEHNQKLRTEMLQFVERHTKEIFSCNVREVARAKGLLKQTFKDPRVDQFLSEIDNLRPSEPCTTPSKPAKPVPRVPLPRSTASTAPEAPIAPILVATLSEAIITFNTTNDDKDANTGVAISIDCGGRPVVRTFGTWGKWPDNTSSGPIPLTVIYGPHKDQIKGKCQATIVEAPVGHDEWHFNWSLQLRFSDRTSFDYNFSGENVDHDRRTVAKQL